MDTGALRADGEPVLAVDVREICDPNDVADIRARWASGALPTRGDVEVLLAEFDSVRSYAITTETIRDRFAMAALTGLLANPATSPSSIAEEAHLVGVVAYAVADVAMAAREAQR